MKHLRITVEGKVYEVAVEIVGSEAGGSNAETQGRSRAAAAAVRSGKAVAAPAPATSPVAAAKPVAAPAAVATAPAGAGAVCSPLTALVVSIDVSVGDNVEVGDRLVTLEAMKMNTIVNAARAGKVTAIHVAAADAVEEGQPLVTVE